MKSMFFQSLPLREQQGLMIQMRLNPEMTSLNTTATLARMSPMTGNMIGTLTPNARMILCPPLVPSIRPLTGLEAMHIQEITEQSLDSWD